jgi:hypothetical protein
MCVACWSFSFYKTCEEEFERHERAIMTMMMRKGKSKKKEAHI